MFTVIDVNPYDIGKFTANDVCAQELFICTGEN